MAPWLGRAPAELPGSDAEFGFERSGAAARPGAWRALTPWFVLVGIATTFAAATKLHRSASTSPGAEQASLADIVGFAEQPSASQAGRMLEHVERMLADDKRMKQWVHGLFKVGDADGSGHIEEEELAALVEQLSDSLNLDHPTEQERATLLQDLRLAGKKKLSESDLLPLAKKSLKDLTLVLQERLAVSVIDHIQSMVHDTLKGMTHELFREADLDKNGFVDSKEFKNMTAILQKTVGIKPSMKPAMEAMQADLEDATTKKKKKKLSEADLRPVVKGLMQDVLASTEQELCRERIESVKAILGSKEKFAAASDRMFRKADADESGLLEPKEMEGLLSEIGAYLGLGKEFTEKSQKMVIDKLDKTGNGKVDNKEFEPLLKEVMHNEQHILETYLQDISSKASHPA